LVLGRRREQKGSAIVMRVRERRGRTRKKAGERGEWKERRREEGEKALGVECPLYYEKSDYLWDDVNNSYYSLSIRIMSQA